MRVTAKKLVVSTYLQYILIALGVLLLFTFVRQLSGVLLTFLLAAILAYMLNPLVRIIEGGEPEPAVPGKDPVGLRGSAGREG